MQKNNSLAVTNSSFKPHIKRTSRDWQKLVIERENSSLTLQDFCRQKKISKSCFYKWRKHFSQTNLKSDFVDITDTITSINPAPAQSNENHSTLKFELELGHGMTLRVWGA